LRRYQNRPAPAAGSAKSAPLLRRVEPLSPRRSAATSAIPAKRAAKGIAWYFEPSTTPAARTRVRQKGPRRREDPRVHDHVDVVARRLEEHDGHRAEQRSGEQRA